MTPDRLSDLLLPRPAELTVGGPGPALVGVLGIEISGELELPEQARRRVEEALRHDRLRPSQPQQPAAGLPLHLDFDPGIRPQGYRLAVEPEGCRLVAADEPGLFYGCATLAQWIRLHAESGRLDGLRVDDAPSFRHRGVLLDISRNKVPTMESLFDLVERLASWKINQLQLYTEHTFAYAGHETVWEGADPLTADEVRQLDAYCRERFVELVPNQNSFGHFHRWLVHEPYRALAERPEGIEHPFSSAVEPFGLCPTDPGSLTLLADLYGQLLPNFSSPQFNVGLDETIDLGTGRSREECEARGKGAVYLQFLKRVHALAAEHGRRVQFWADIVIADPELIPQLPTDAIPLVWGYEAGHPFAEQLAPFAEAGYEHYVCPGTSSWNSLAGRWDNARRNLSEAALAGREARATGYLITDWGDHGHLQPLTASYPGFVAAASFGWNADTALEPAGIRAGALLDHYAFDAPGSGLGEVTLDLANAFLDPGPRPKNASTLFHLLAFPERRLDDPRYEGLTEAGLRRALERVTAAAGGLEALVGDDGASQARAELEWSASILAWACRLGLLRLDEAATAPAAASRNALVEELGPLTERLRRIWLARNRGGGLEASEARLEAVGDALRA